MRLDEGFTGLTLSVQAIEVLFKSFFGRFAGVDGATDSFAHSPKNLGPDQRAPVIAVATFERDE